MVRVNPCISQQGSSINRVIAIEYSMVIVYCIGMLWISMFFGKIMNIRKSEKKTDTVLNYYGTESANRAIECKKADEQNRKGRRGQSLVKKNYS